MALIALRKLILQTRMRRNLIFGQTLRLLSYVMCANSEGSSETSLFAYVISPIISWAGSFQLKYVLLFYKSVLSLKKLHCRSRNVQFGSYLRRSRRKKCRKMTSNSDGSKRPELTSCTCLYPRIIRIRHFSNFHPCWIFASYTGVDLVHDVRPPFWHFDVSIWHHFLQKVSTSKPNWTLLLFYRKIERITHIQA